MRTLNELIHDIDSVPQKIADARRAVYDARVMMERYKNEVEDLEADILTEVSQEVNDFGKPRYSNKEAREAAAKRIIKDRADYKKILAAREEWELTKQNAEISLGQLEATEKSLYAQLDAALAEARRGAIVELTRGLLELARLEEVRLTRKEASHA